MTDKKKKVTVKGVDISSLNKRQQDVIKKHMVSMTNMMKRGSTFTEAHKKAQKKVGT